MSPGISTTHLNSNTSKTKQRYKSKSSRGEYKQKTARQEIYGLCHTTVTIVTPLPPILPLPRKICKNCLCPREEHDVGEDKDDGVSVGKILFSSTADTASNRKISDGIAPSPRSASDIASFPATWPGNETLKLTGILLFSSCDNRIKNLYSRVLSHM